MAEDYRISLGVDLDTSDLKKKIEALDNKHSIKLGVDLKVNDIRDRISAYNKNTNNAKLKLGISLDTDDLKKQISQLDLGGKGKGKGVAIPVNTASLENSLKEVRDIIADIKNSLGTLDNGNTKSLVSSVNQIASALEKATDESNGLLASLKKLSEKDFNVNFGLNLGGSNPIKRNAAYGNKVRKETLPQLKHQAKALENYFKEYYKINDGFTAIWKLSNDRRFEKRQSDLYELTPYLNNSSESLATQMATYKEYIAIIKEAAQLKGIDISSVTSSFSVSADNLIKDAEDIQTGAKETEESFIKLKQIMGGGIDADGLGQVLEPLLSDIGEIKRAFESLSSIGTIDGLTASFKELSEVLDKLTSNITVARQNLDNIGGNLGSSAGNANTNIDNLEQDLKQAANAAEQTSDAINNLHNRISRTSSTSSISDDLKQSIIVIDATEDHIENLQRALNDFGFNSSSIDAIVSDISSVGFEVKKITHQLNDDGSVRITVQGIDDLNNIVTAIKSVRMVEDPLGGEDLIPDIRSITKVTQSLNEVEESFKRLKSLGKEMGDIKFKIAGLDADKNVNEIAELKSKLDALGKEYDQLFSTVSSKLSNTQLDELAKDAENASDKISILEARMADTSAAKQAQEQTQKGIREAKEAYEQMLDIQKRIRSLFTKAANLDESKNINELKELDSQFQTLTADYETLKRVFGDKLTSVQFGNLQAEIDDTDAKVNQLNARIKDIRDTLAKKIKLDIELGNYDNQISQMDDKFNRLSSASKELYESVEQVHQAYTRMELALESAGDGVADKERLIQAEKEYARALENANNLLRIQAREEKSDADKLKLIDDIQVFQSKIDAWLTKNSAAAKDFGAAMLDLKAKAENCDRTELNHLEKEFKQLDYAAEKAGKKMMTIGDQIKTKFKEYSAYFSVAEVFMYVEQGLRSMFEQVKLIDSAMTELKKVTDETNESYDRFLTNAASRAKEIGTTIDGLVSSTADFARLGYGFEDAQGLAEVANIYAVVGDEIENVEVATESLVSTLAAFKSEMNGLSDSEFALSIVDKMNEVSNNFSISSGGIGEALKRSASSMQAANNSLDETIALITAANEVTQDPETVGQAFKTISMRIRGAKTELEDAGESTEGMAESTATLRKEIMALSGVDIMLNEDTFKSTYQIMDELSQKWEGLSDIAQASIIELVAGKHRGNVMASLMSNFDTARSALETSLNSSGSAMAEHAKWSESLEARINSLSASWQALSQTFLQSDFLKGALDGVIGLIDGVTKLIDTFGTLPTLITAFSTIQSFRGHGFFKVILDEATGTAVDIENVFSKAFSKISLIFSESSGINFSEEFSNSLNLDAQALRNYEGAILRGVSETEAFDMCLSGASETTKEYIQSGKFATETISEFVNRQKAAQVTLVAQNKTWASAKDIIAEYNSGCINTAMSQKDFISAVNAGNSGLGKYLSGLNGAKGSLGGYVASLIGAKAATIGLQIATTALNAVIGMGIGALVSVVISGITKWINAEEDLAEKVEEVTSKFKEQHEELQKLKGDYDTTNESSMVSRYDKLSKGVDNLGRNLSLTADEYSEYQSIVNTISDQFPSLINGYDSQGNAILSCKDNVESLVSAYEDLIRAQNNAILTENIKDIGKDFANKVDKNEKQGFWESVGSFFNLDNIGLMDIEMTEVSAQYLKQMLNAKNDAELEKIINTMTAFSSFDGNDEGAIMTALEKAGVDTGILGFGLKDALKDTVKNNPQKIRDILESFYNGFEEDVSQMKSIAQATLSNAFDLRDSEYYDMSDTMQSVAKNIVNNLDYEFYKQYKDNPLGVQTYINDMLEQLNSLDTTVNKEIETALNLKTQFNNGEVSYGEYVNGVQEAGEIIDGLALDDEIKKDIKLSLGLSEKDGKWFIEEYNALLTRLTSEDYNIQMKTEDAEAFLNALNSNEYAVALDFILSGEVDSSNLNIDSLKKYIEEQAKIREALNFTIAIDVEAESVELLNAAMAESVSGAGLSSESISALKSRYSELASEGYDLSAMFEETSNGIHLNREAVSELEQEYAKQKLSETNDNLKVLKDRYDELTDEINNASDASERASLYREQQSIVQKINDLSTLASQYQGLTSAYNAWLNAEEAGSERDMYENIIEGFETVGDEISRGWIDDGTIKFLELLTGQTDLASKSGRELKELYDSLGNVIGNSGYGISDFFTVDEDGNSTNAGVYNFLETVESFENQLGDVIRRGEDGSIIGFDFEVAGGDKAIAEALGISEELVQIMVRAADDAGFVINIDGAYTQLADLKTEAEAARDSLITLKRDGLESLQDVDVTFDLEATGNDLIKEQEKAINLLNKFKKEDGTIDLSITGAQEALDIAEYLTIKIDDLTEPKYMQVDASSLEEELQEPIEKMQEFERLSKEKHLLTLTGDTTKLAETEAKMDEIAQYLDDIDDKEVQAKLGITGLTKEEIAEKLEKGEIELDAELSIDVQMSDDLKDMRLMMMNQLGLVSNEEVKLKIGFDIDDSVVDKLTDEQKQVVVEYLVNDEDVKNYTPEQKEALVKYIADGGSLDDFTPEEKEAFVNYLVDGGSVEGYTPEDKKALAKYLVDGGDPANYQPPSKQQEVKADLDSSEPDNYQPDEKTQPVTAKLNSSVVDNYQPPEKTMTIWAKIKKKASELWDKITGGGGVDGTAHVDGTAFVNGTTGRAFKQGNWGTKDSGIALGGEEAPELLVRNGRWHLIGERGAEFFGYKKGDIIFNASQTKEIFEKGKITHGNGRGKALANGTAFSGGTGAGFGKVQTIAETTTETTPTTTTTTTTTKTTTGGSSGSGGGTKVSGKNVTSEKDAAGTKEEIKEFEDTIDWIETILDRAERAIDKYEKQANNIYKTWDKRNEALENEISEVNNTRSLYEQAKNQYLSEANAVGLDESYASKVRNGSLNIEDFKGESDETLVEKIKNYQDLYEKYLDCIDKIEELKEQEASLYAQRFDNVQSEYDNLLQGFNHTQAMLEEYVNQAESKGYIVSKNYYDALIKNEQDRINTLKQEQISLIKARDEAVANNEFDKYSEDWYRMCEEIDSVTQAIESGATSLIEYNNAIRDIDFEVFELMQERISDITAEADFLIELMSHKDLFDDKGNLTEQGQATIGLHGQNYNTYMYQADEYSAKAAEIDKQIAEDPYDQELINKRREYLELQRECILNAENEKEAIKSLVEEGIEIELDNLSELIDKYQDALQSQKDLYDYQKRVEEQTKNIASLQKQLTSLQGDDSEESKKRIQELKVSLEKAESDLQETEYDKYISDTSALLDNLYTEYELMLNERIDNLDYLIAQQIEAVNANASVISETLSAEADAVGYTLSSAMNDIWNGEQAVLTMYGEDFKLSATNINTTLNGIKTSIDNMVVALDKKAEEKIEQPKTKPSSVEDPVKTANNNNNTNDNNDKKEEPKREITNDTLMGIAAAIWNYQKENYGGWGANPDRKKKLTDKLGAENAAKVQSYINSYGATGKLYNLWISKGKNLNDYKYSAFKLGAKNIDETQLAWTQEQGQEYIIRPSDGAILTPVAKGDSVLTSAATNNIWQMANSPTEFIRDNLSLGATSIPNNSTVQNSITQNFDKVVFSMPNVRNYDELITQMQKDPNFERLVETMSIGKLTGKSSLAKGKAIR